MPLSPTRAARALPLSISLALFACSSAEPATLTCETSAECPAGTRCIARGCVANSTPAAAVSLPAGEMEANLLHSFDGSASSDPDEGDAVASFAWIFRSLDAPCEPPTVAGAGPVAAVRFACPGRYALDLTAVDSMGAEGTTTVEFTVIPYAGPALVVTAADLAVDHTCTLAPLRCVPVGSVVLGATAPSLPPEDVSFAWSVEPPEDRPLDGTRRVTFRPATGVAAPEALIETDGTGISGDWIFRVVASDAAGVLGSATMRVSVRNRPPVVTGTLPSPVNHAFTGGVFTASGAIAVAVSDPDGDPLVQRAALWRHVGDGPGGSFEGADQQSELTFSIAVPYDDPSHALHLIGGTGLERSVELAVSDVNGARSAASWTVVVDNRPPVLVSTPAPFTVEHSFADLAYGATATLSSWSDPDGDPLLPVPGSPSGDPRCSVVVDASGVARAECSLAFLGVPAVANFAGTHAVTQHVQDPWTPAPPRTATFTIGNRPPSIDSSATHLYGGTCTVTGCCSYIAGEGCVVVRSTSPAGSSAVPSRWSDPDGDPLGVDASPSATITPAPIVCMDSSCSLPLTLAQLTSVCGDEAEVLPVTVTDGAAAATFSLTVERGCPRQ